MGPLASILSWLFFHTIYGLFAVAALLYVALREVRKRFPRAPNPTFVVGPVVLIGLFVLPSIPRYYFEKQTLAQIEGKGWMRVVHTMKWATSSNR